MADLVKKIKIKKQDGTFTDYIPIGAEAQNVSTSDGDSVQLKLNKKPYYYNSVADMKADTKLKVGDMAVTLGYYKYNDGGAAEYKIVQSSDKYTETLDNNLKAEINIKDKMCVNQFGAKGDGITDDTIAIQNTVTYSSYITFLSDKTYMIKGYRDGDPQGGTSGIHDTKGIMIPSNRTIDLCQATIKIITNDRQNYNAFTIKQVENVTIQNGNLIGDVDTHTGTTGQWGYGIALLSSKIIYLKDLYITKMWGDGINLQCDGTGYPQNSYIYINNVICDDNRRQGMSIESCDYLYVTDCSFINTGVTAYQAPAAGIDIEPLPYGFADHMWIYNCIFKDNIGAHLIAMNDSRNLMIDGCYFFDCEGRNGAGYISFPKCFNYTIKNCRFEHSSPNFHGAFIGLALANNKVTIRNNYFKNIGMLIHHFIYNDKIFIKDNYMDLTECVWDYNNGIECQAASDTSVVNKNICYIDNNTIIAGENLKAHISVAKLSGITDIQIRKNTFIRGSRGMQCSDSANIENNHFISQRLSTMQLEASATNLKEGKNVYNISNNIIENPNCRNSSAKGVIYNPNSTTGYYILNNNVCYEKYCINPDYRYDTDTGPSNVRWLETTTTGRALIEDSNHIYVINFEDGLI